MGWTRMNEKHMFRFNINTINWNNFNCFIFYCFLSATSVYIDDGQRSPKRAKIYALEKYKFGNDNKRRISSSNNFQICKIFASVTETVQRLSINFGQLAVRTINTSTADLAEVYFQNWKKKQKKKHGRKTSMVVLAKCCDPVWRERDDTSRAILRNVERTWPPSRRTDGPPPCPAEP